MAPVVVLCGYLLLLLTASSTSVIELYVPEELPPGSDVGNVPIDAGVYEKYPPEVAVTLRFRILFQSPPSVASSPSNGQVAKQSLFSVDELTGDVRTVLRIDREEYCRQASRCTALVDVVVQPTEFFEILRVRIHIIDINDNTPVFPVPVLVFALPESQNADAVSSTSAGLLVPEADDPDGPAYGVQQYVIVSMTAEVEEVNGYNATSDVIPFDVNHEHGQIRIVPTHILDRESVARYRFRLVAVDGGKPRRSGSVEIVVTITDLNDNSPTFASAMLEARVREDSAVGTVVCRATANDADVGLNAELRYRFTAETRRQHGATFDVRADTGAVVVVGALDYETRRDYSLYVMATDRAGADEDDGRTLTSMISIFVHVDDVNDHAPDIAFNFRRPTPDNQQSGFQQRDVIRDQPFPVVTVNRAADVGSFVAHVTVRDADDGENGRFRCVLFSSLGDGHESNATGNYFALRQIYDTEYMIVTTARLDALSATTDAATTLDIYCADGGRPTLTSEASLIVTVGNPTHEHENMLSDVSPRKVIAIAVAENVPKGTSIYCPRPSEKDKNSVIKSFYRITDALSNSVLSASQFFDVDATSGVVKTAATLDRKNLCRMELDLWKDTDVTSSRQSAVRLSIVVSRWRQSYDYDDTAIVRHADVDYEFFVAENSPRGTYVGSVSATDLCLPTSKDKNDHITYELVGKDSSKLSRFFHLGAGDGRLTTAEPLDRESRRDYSLLVLARLSTDITYVDAAGCQLPTTRTTAVVESLARLHVTVADVNDNSPIFEFPRPGNDTIPVSSTAAPGRAVSRIIARDGDAGFNGSLSYYIESQSSWSKAFSIDHTTGVIYLTAAIERIHFPSGEFSMKVSATDGGHPALSTVATLRLMIRDDNQTVPSGNVRPLMRSVLASDRLATVLAILLVGVVLTIALILLCAVIIDRRCCRLPDKLAEYSCLPMRWRHRKTDESVADVLTMTCCCCCVNENRHRRKCKSTMSVGDTAATSEDVSRSTSNVVSAAVRRVSTFDES